MTNPKSVTVFTTHRTALDPTIRNPDFDIPTKSTKMYLSFPIYNGEFYSTHEKLNESMNILLTVMTLVILISLKLMNLCVHQRIRPSPYPVT